MIDGDDKPELDLSRLKVISALGRGAKGVVFLVQNDDEELFALKAICRANIERKMNGRDDSEESAYKRIWFEKEVLRRFDHPLLPRLRGTVLTEKVVGYAIDYCPGRDLNSLRRKQTEKMFSDDIIRFYAAELVLALEYLHGLGIAYRDLKPENILIQENGHLMLVDFDLSKKLSPISPQSRILSLPKTTVTKKKKLKKNRSSFALHFCNSGITPEEDDSAPAPQVDSVEKSNSFVGTEEYVAPEIVSGLGHDFAVDWWCLGVVLHEMLYGTTPFRGINRKETFYRILTKAPELVGEATPLRDLIRKLLEKDLRARIGLEEIKGHEFFAGVDWGSIVRLPRPPYIPTEPHEEEDSNGIDVESFVQQVFKIGNENGVETNDKKVSERERKQDFVNTNTSTNDGVWVDSLGPHLSPNEFSSVF